MLKCFLYPILLGIIIGIIVSLSVLLALSVAASSLDIPPVAVIPLAVVSNALGAAVSAFVAKFGKRNGWLLGSISALILFLVTTAAGFGLYHTADGAFLAIKASIMLACGMVGGIVAVNSKKKRARR